MTDPKLPPEGEGRPNADAFGRGLARGLGLNLVVGDMAASLRFHTHVLRAEIPYWDQDFAIAEALGSVWMLHHDRTYRNHPLIGMVRAADGRGIGAELRLYGLDPDEAEARAADAGGTVLAGAADKPHGLREAYILDPEGYLWVPSVAKRAG